MTARRANARAPAGDENPPALSEQLQRWLADEGEKTVGSLVDTFGEKSFAVLFVLLLAVPALPLPTGGVTHVFELMAGLVALQQIAGRREIWLPQRWRGRELAAQRQQRFVAALTKLIRRLERYSRPRGRRVFRRRLTRVIFGVLVLGGTVAAFLAPPFSGLDTMPALGVVLLALGWLLEDLLVVLAGIALGAAGVVLEIVLGAAALHGISSIL
jgi:hypothetical protein